MSDVISKIRSECERIEEDVEHSAKRHFNASSMWSWVHYLIGIPMTICAAWAGIDAFSDVPKYSGYLALATAALAALQTFLNAGDQVSKHKNSGDEYLALRNQTRLFREIEINEDDKEGSIKRIRELSEKRDELNGISPHTPYLAFWLAKRGIDKGEAQYRADKKET